MIFKININSELFKLNRCYSMDNPRIVPTRLFYIVNIKFIKQFYQILKYKFFLYRNIQVIVTKI